MLVRSEDLDKARALQHSGNAGGNAGMSSRSYSQTPSQSLTHTMVSAGMTNVGVLTPPPMNRSKAIGGISGLLDAADQMSQEDRDLEDRQGKLSPRELKFDDRVDENEAGEEDGQKGERGELNEEGKDTARTKDLGGKRKALEAREQEQALTKDGDGGCGDVANAVVKEEEIPGEPISQSVPV